MNKKICFFEPNEAFAERLIDYWTDHGLAEYQICYYSDADRWRRDRESVFADLWILDCSLQTADFFPPPRGRILWWSDRQEDAEAIFKYRSAAVLLRVIQKYLNGGADAGQTCAGTRLISLYSPIKRCLQTTFGITLAHILSTKGRVLYLNLEGYSGLDHMLKRSFSKDISDFIYYVNHLSGDIPFVTQNYIYRLGNVDIIPPVLNPVNLQDISEDMWIQMLDILRDSGLYDYILVDVSDFILGTFSILRESSVIFSMIRSDNRAEAKWQQYCSMLEEAGYADILNKTKQQELPQIAILPGNLEEYTPGPVSEIAECAAKEAGLL